MPNLNSTREELETAFIAGWGSTTPIKHDNVKFDDTKVQSYVSVKMINYTSKNVCIGSAVTKRKRHTGVFAVKIYIKQNISTDSAYALADQITTIMDNLNQNNVITLSSETRRNGAAPDGWFGLITDVPYMSDEN